VTVLLVILYILVCLFLVMVVLLQQGKGADLAGAFGGGGSQTSFGPRGGTNIMHRLTTGAFVLFVLLCLTLTILSGKRRTSVMESVVPAAAPAETTQPQENAVEKAITEENAGGEVTADQPGPAEEEVVPAPGDQSPPPEGTAAENSGGASQ
jgi:preprotein translocase subunit SecG